MIVRETETSVLNQVQRMQIAAGLSGQDANDLYKELSGRLDNSKPKLADERPVRIPIPETPSRKE